LDTLDKEEPLDRATGNRSTGLYREDPPRKVKPFFDAAIIL
jgi:hypothetical protein